MFQKPDKNEIMSELGRELSSHNHQIVKCIQELHQQRDELGMLIQIQEDEKAKLENEVERINYKLALIDKSLTQRQRAKQKYDETITEAEKHYEQLVKSSGILRNAVCINVDQLQQSIDKKVGTENDIIEEEELKSEEPIKEETAAKDVEYDEYPEKDTISTGSQANGSKNGSFRLENADNASLNREIGSQNDVNNPENEDNGAKNEDNGGNASDNESQGGGDVQNEPQAAEEPEQTGSYYSNSESEI